MSAEFHSGFIHSCRLLFVLFEVWLFSCHTGYISPSVDTLLFFLTGHLSPPPAGCATSFQVTVVTSTSWNVIAMAASTNITESGAPMLSPSRCSRCVGFSNETGGRLSQPLTLYLLHILLLFLPSPSHSSAYWCFNSNFVLFCCQL